jgi:hypothetical protein
MQDKKQNKQSLLFAKDQYSPRAYRTTERDGDLLSAIETCKAYKTILLGYPAIVFTVLKNKDIFCRP